MKISASQVKELREITGAGMMDCKKALEEAEGDLEKAMRILREKGWAQLAKRAERETREGIVESYIHAGGKIGVLVEVNCETDFVARNEQLKNFAHELALQIAASRPLYLSRDEIPNEVLEKEKGDIENFFSETCLLEQPFIKDTDITIRDLLGSYASKLGENIVIRRFIRFEIGEGFCGKI